MDYRTLHSKTCLRFTQNGQRAESKSTPRALPRPSWWKCWWRPAPCQAVADAERRVASSMNAPEGAEKPAAPVEPTEDAPEKAPEAPAPQAAETPAPRKRGRPRKYPLPAPASAPQAANPAPQEPAKAPAQDAAAEQPAPEKGTEKPASAETVSRGRS